MRLRASQLAVATGGILCGPDLWVEAPAIDSREVTGGELFVPSTADRDGHDYIADAVARGAACYLRPGPPAPAPPSGWGHRTRPIRNERQWTLMDSKALLLAIPTLVNTHGRR